MSATTLILCGIIAILSFCLVLFIVINVQLQRALEKEKFISNNLRRLADYYFIKHMNEIKKCFCSLRYRGE